MIRYVDSSGWTWDVCEVARDLVADATSATATDPPPAARDAARPFADHHRRRGADGPADRPARSSPPGAPARRTTDDPFAADSALYFLSRIGTRKLRHYPPSWHELPHAELEALCWSADVV